MLTEMSLEAKVGQMILVGFEGYSIAPGLCQLIKDLSPGGIVLRKGNVDTPDQLRSLSVSAQECTESGGKPAIINCLRS